MEHWSWWLFATKPRDARWRARLCFWTLFSNIFNQNPIVFLFHCLLLHGLAMFHLVSEFGSVPDMNILALHRGNMSSAAADSLKLLGATKIDGALALGWRSNYSYNMKSYEITEHFDMYSLMLILRAIRLLVDFLPDSARFSLSWLLFTDWHQRWHRDRWRGVMEITWKHWLVPCNVGRYHKIQVIARYSSS